MPWTETNELDLAYEVELSFEKLPDGSTSAVFNWDIVFVGDDRWPWVTGTGDTIYGG